VPKATYLVNLQWKAKFARRSNVEQITCVDIVMEALVALRMEGRRARDAAGEGVDAPSFRRFKLSL